MRWPWRVRKNRHCASPEAQMARARAQMGVRQEMAKAQEVKRTVDSLRSARGRNGFGEAMIGLFRGEST